MFLYGIFVLNIVLTRCSAGARIAYSILTRLWAGQSGVRSFSLL